MRLLIFLMLITLSHSVAAETKEALTPHQKIKVQAERYLQSYFAQQDNVKIAVSKLDKRIPVDECASGYTYSIPGKALPQNYTSVKVTCADTGWYLFVKAQIRQTVSVVVVTGSLNRGETIAASDLQLIQLDSSQVRGDYYSDMDGLVGARVKRKLAANMRIGSRDICVVCKGDQITVSASKGALKVTASGTAMSDGLIGESIKIRNNRSKKQVTARIISPGIAERRL